MFMTLNDEYIQHKLVVIVYMFMVLNDEYIHHDLEVMLCLFMVLNDECTFSTFQVLDLGFFFLRQVLVGDNSVIRVVIASKSL